MGYLILFLIAAVLLVLLFAPLDAELFYHKNLYNQEEHFNLRYFGIKIPIPKGEKKKQKEKKEEAEEQEKTADESVFARVKAFRSAYWLLREDLSAILHFLSKKAVRIREFSFSLDFGLEDPALTGILSGIVYGVYYNLLALIDQNLRLEKTETRISPDFQTRCFDLRFRCILRIKPAHIIIVLLKCFKIYLKYRKKRKEVDGHGASDSRADGHSNEKY